MTYKLYQHPNVRLVSTFFQDAFESYPDPDYIVSIQRGLVPFGAHYCLNNYYDHKPEDEILPDKGPYIEFKDERYYSMFVLRYS